ncbi:hypothetical protein BDY21DRAFT_51315 [Lineolata rhizophorae]|uniref:Uncharacterized protein n=1 Tax=Lineolata rhizophorae TaxID=578093 RepID=A0A6A6NY55_9PEZI|nr:hypothetical protein BDY21DRAFT_51315 [Lineolata rhizophorae]
MYLHPFWGPVPTRNPYRPFDLQAPPPAGKFTRPPHTYYLHSPSTHSHPTYLNSPHRPTRSPGAPCARVSDRHSSPPDVLHPRPRGAAPPRRGRNCLEGFESRAGARARRMRRRAHICTVCTQPHRYVCMELGKSFGSRSLGASAARCTLRAYVRSVYVPSANVPWGRSPRDLGVGGGGLVEGEGIGGKAERDARVALDGGISRVMRREEDGVNGLQERRNWAAPLAVRSNWARDAREVSPANYVAT